MTTEQLPRANLSDIPEMMPGAGPSANPAQRAEFEKRSRQLHQEDVEDYHARSGEAAQQRALSGVGTTVDELALMFPSLDPDLVRVIASDFPTPQHAIETLLTLVESSSEPTMPPLPPKDLPLEDL